MELTKKQKAFAFALYLNFGYNDYNDSCEYNYKFYKFKYVCADEGKTYYLSQKELAKGFDNMTKEEQEDCLDFYKQRGGQI